MTHRVNIHEAKTHFSRLLKLAHNGEEVIVAKAGRDYARIVPIRSTVERTPGAFAGQIEGDALSPISQDDAEAWG